MIFTTRERPYLDAGGDFASIGQKWEMYIRFSRGFLISQLSIQAVGVPVQGSAGGVAEDGCMHGLARLEAGVKFVVTN